jgi:hypothetical protein
MLNDIAKLPKWAQIHIRDQAAKISRLEIQVTDIQLARNAGASDTETFVDHVIPHDDDPQRFQRLPRGAHIVWWTGEGYPVPHFGRIGAYWNFSEQAVVLTTSGAGRLSVEPQMNNCVLIRETGR